MFGYSELSRPLSWIAAAAVVFSFFTGCGGQSSSRIEQATSEQVGASQSKETPTEIVLGKVKALDLQSSDPAVARAIQKATGGVEADSTSALAWGDLGMSLLAHDFFTAAADCFGLAAELDPTEPRWPYFHSIALRPDDGQQAITLLRTALPLFGDASVVPRLRLADWLLQDGKLEEAEDQLNAVLRRDRENGRAFYHLGQVRFMKQDYQGCLDNMQKAQQLGVQQRQGMLLVSETYRRQGDLERADDYRTKAMNLRDAGWPDPYYQQVLDQRTGLKTQLVKADLLFGSGSVLESVRLLQRTAEEYPESEWAQIYLARGLIRLRRLSEAQSALNEALQLAPECAEIYFRMAVLLALRGDLRTAADWYRQAIERKPDMAMAYNNLGHCLLKLNDEGGAEAAFRRSVEVHPGFFEGHASLGTLYQQQGKSDAARVEFTAALKLQPDNSYVQERMRQLENEDQTNPTSEDGLP